MIEQRVSAEILNPEQFKCPKCQNTALLVEGYVQAPMIGVVEDGLITTSTVNDEAKKIEISAFDCSHCQIHYIVKSVEVMNMETELFKLHTDLFKLNDMYKKATGIDLLGMGQPC
jgi:hypothetical protein